jgi:hypothetical protein
MIFAQDFAHHSHLTTAITALFRDPQGLVGRLQSFLDETGETGDG